MSTKTVKSPSPLTNLLVQGSVLSGIEAVIFDKDGTLADARGFLLELAQRRVNLLVTSLREVGLTPSSSVQQSLCDLFGLHPELDPDGLMASGSRQANHQAAVEWMLLAGCPDDQVEQRVVDVFGAADRQCPAKVTSTPPFPGTLELLARLANSGLTLGVLSSDSTAQVEDFLRGYQLQSWLAGWRGTEIGEPAKPDPTLFYQLCETLQVSPRATVIVGDSRADLGVAKQAGAAAFISVSQAWGRSPVPGCQLVVRSWSDLEVLSTSIGAP